MNTYRARYSDLKEFNITEKALGELKGARREELQIRGDDGNWYRPFRFQDDGESIVLGDD